MISDPPHILAEHLNPATALSKKLWTYTNYDCHLRCTYCVAESTPPAARREIEIDTVRRLVDEAVVIGFDETFFTGGEPFILPGLSKLAPEQTSLISVITCKECPIFLASLNLYLQAVPFLSLFIRRYPCVYRRSFT